MIIDILTMFPELFPNFRNGPVIARANKNGTLKLRIIDMKEFTEGCFRKLDDSSYGGGPGMVLRCQPVVDAIRAAKRDRQETGVRESRVILLDPTGIPFSQKKARELSAGEHLILVCGHYEGFDARIFEYADEVISLGDFILTGGEIPAMAVTDAIARLLPGSIREGGTTEESFETGLLEYPQYTKPRDFEGQKVPEVLFSGNHEAIRQWRENAALERTKKLRPDLLEKKQEGE